jgi:hypothetical protein
MAGTAIKKTTTLAIVFGCGGLFFVNLDGLVSGVGNGYRASWLNVFLSLAMTAWQSRYLISVREKS